jgi:hypothetical protein
MFRSFPAVLAVALLFGSAFLSAVRAADEKKDAAAADADKARPVKFETIDQVELHGMFYPGKEPKKTPCVLMLHPLGKDIKEDGWDRLALELQKKGMTVLMFDFRGHGGSTSIQPDFWTLPATAGSNRTVKGYNSNPMKCKTSITFKDFPASYFPRLVDDIAAAKLFLDKKNDDGECNSSSLIVIGAEEGATLGAMWMDSEFRRYQIVGGTGVLNQKKLASNPEGKSILCGVWLSISPEIHKTQMPVTEWLKSLGKEKKVPMFFVYGSKDAKGESFAKRCLEASKTGQKLELTVAKAVDGTQLTGAALLGKSLDTVELISSKYLDRVVKEKTVADWDKHDAEKTAYVWLFGYNRVLAKIEGDKSMSPLPLMHYMQLR